MDSQVISALLRKTEHYDKDERYMATSDLCELLKRQSEYISSHNNDTTTSSAVGGRGGGGSSAGNVVLMDTNTERQVCSAVLRLLHDNSNDVQAIAVKTLGVLLTTVHAEQVAEIADSLVTRVLDISRTELRDVFTIGLRTLVKTIPAPIGNTTVSDRLVRPLLEGIRTNSMGVLDANKQDIILSSLDVLTDLIGRFGATSSNLTRQHEPILQMCLQQLQRTDATATVPGVGSANGNASSTSNALLIRKRAGNTLGCLSVVLSDTLLQRMVDSILQLIEQCTSGPSNTGSTNATTDIRALIRTMCTIAGAVGQRLGQAQLDRILPILLRFTNPKEAITRDDDDDDEDEDGGVGDDVTMSNAFVTSGMSEEAAVQLANELRESCFVGFESFLLRCPHEIEAHLPNIIRAALAFMAYDPNYSYGPDEDDDDNDDGNPAGDNDDEDAYGAEDDEEFENGDDEFDDEDDDDDDESWKVRRSAIRVLLGIVEAKKHDPIMTLWKTKWHVRKHKQSTVAAALVSRFKEREENCRVAVIECFSRLLDVTIQCNKNGTLQLSSISSYSDDDNMKVDEDAATTNLTINFHDDYSSKVVKACEKILDIKKGSERSKSSVLSLLAKLSQTPGGICGQEQIASVFKHIKVFLSSASDNTTSTATTAAIGTTKALRLDALQLAHAMLLSSSGDPSYANPEKIRQSLRSTLLPELCFAVQEQWYKVIAEALRTIAEVPRFFTNVGYKNDEDTSTRQQECTEVATQLFTAIEPLLAKHDVDQEIKECALKACSTLMSSLHSYLTSDQSNHLLSLLLDRLKNETTRLLAIRTISSIATTTTSSSKSDVLAPIFAESILTMSSFLKLANRSLQQSSLEAIEKIIDSTATTSDSNQQLYSTVLQEVASLIVDRDMHITYLCLRVSVSILNVCPASGPAVRDNILEPTLILTASSHLQDNALESVLALLKEIVRNKTMTFQDVYSMLNVRLQETMTKHGVYNLSKCIAIVATVATDANRSKFLSDTFNSLKGAPTPDSVLEIRNVQLSILITGDFGRMVDLSSVMSLDRATKLKEIYLQYFDSTAEDLKHAASYALGNASIGASAIFLEAIVNKLSTDNSTKHQFLVLAALREFIQCTAKNPTAGDVTSSLLTIVPSLEKHCSAEEDGVRTMVAECLGSLVCLNPETMLPKLEGILESSSSITASHEGYVEEDDSTSKTNARICSTIASSIKVAVASKVDATIMAAHMPKFVKLLQVQELQCRNAALLMVYSAAHHSPQTVSGIMRDLIMPSLYTISALKLARQVDLGPFKHTIDDALPLRKAALSIFATCLENIPGSFDIHSFMPILAAALNDVEDIQLHAHQIVISMCSKQPSYVVAAADTFVDPLEKTINKKQGTKTGTELERFNDWMKSALRVMVTVSRLDGVMNSARRFEEFVERVRNNSKYTPFLQALDEEQ